MTYKIVIIEMKVNYRITWWKLDSEN